ncbi:T9SS type A sorting domain-containing protein [Wenyingzhuangia sp. 1_MG-2023]|nr:T9SS type A sorting domain-containing protein [Wenyingzhuangia sp. 1_MG-2023]
MKKIKNVFVALFTLMSFLKINAQTIVNFDTERNTSATIASEITRLVKANPEAIIQFNSPEYDLEDKVVNLPRAITLQGTTNSNVVNLSGHGADNSNIATKFINCRQINFASNDIKIKNLSLTRINGAKYSVFLNMIHGSYNNVNKPDKIIYTGIEFNNVEVSGGGYQVRVGNGIEGKFTNVSFLNFNTIGFWFDRKGNVDSHPKVEWTNCTFSVRNTPGGTPASGTNIEFNDRAISFDAGNTSYPMIWDHSGSTVEKCHFINTGLGASSRGANLILNNNLFDDNVGIVDLIHIEEFSSNFTITNNIFNSIGDATSKVLVFDRELQIVNDILIANNTINGEIQFFLSAYAPNNITIENNNFTNASTQLGSPFINLTYYENATDEPITPRSNPDRTGEFYSKNIIVRNNTGLDRAETGTFEVNLKQGDSESVIDFPSARRTINYVEEPKQLLANGIYEIVNIETGGNIIPSDIDGGLITSNTIENNSSWEITFVPPFTYNIQNVTTGNYLELSIPFTESNLFGNLNNLPDLYPFAKNNYSGLVLSEIKKLPFWNLLKENDNYVILPGGNERQSAIAVTDTIAIKMIPGKFVDPNTGRRAPVVLGNNAKWKFRALDENYISWNTNQSKEFNTGQATQQTINYGVRADNETISYTQFGLAILNTSTNVVTEVGPQSTPSDSSSPAIASETFDFDIPTTIAPSNELPEGQQYIIQVKLATRLSGNSSDTFTTIQSPVTIYKTITENEISWDTNSNTIFSIGETTNQTLTYNVLPSQTPEYTQFGLFITNITNHTIVEVIKPQAFPSDAKNILQRETKEFQYTIPTGIKTSEDLPEGQQYVIRTILSAKEGESASNYTVETTPVTVVAPNNITWDTNRDTQFEEEETSSQTISYNLQTTDQVQFIQFGLLIVNATNNSYISAVAPQTDVVGNNSLTTDTRNFNFTIPSGIKTSANLPANQKYQIRARVSYKDASGTDHFALEFTDVIIVEAGSNFVTWDTNSDTEFELNETTSQTISYRVQPTETIQSVQYGLIITTETTNAYISAVAPGANVNANYSLKEATNTFNFTIPSGIVTSENLPNNQKYRIRTRIDSKDAANTPIVTLEFTDVTIVESSLAVDDIKQNSLTIYPNPVANTLFLSKNIKDEYTVYDMLGQKLLNINTSTSIDVSSLKKGLYILVNSKGSYVKFIKN